MLHFLQNVHGETNLLLKVVSADLSVSELVAGAMALGLICKLLVTPICHVHFDLAFHQVSYGRYLRRRIIDVRSKLRERQQISTTGQLFSRARL